MDTRRSERWAPRVTVATVVSRAGQLLLVEEEKAGRRVLNQPAGHLEPGESLLEAAVREAKAYISAAIAAADRLRVGHGHGPVHRFHAFERK